MRSMIFFDMDWINSLEQFNIPDKFDKVMLFIKTSIEQCIPEEIYKVIICCLGITAIAILFNMIRSIFS